MQFHAISCPLLNVRTCYRVTAQYAPLQAHRLLPNLRVHGPRRVARIAEDQHARSICQDAPQLFRR